jgi:lipopolysaccharide/colanic/teichoic acid biosynthesis glycosyltransferase
MSVANSATSANRPRHAATPFFWRAQAADLSPPPAYFRRKAIIDRILAALLLVPGLPIIGLLIVMVRLTSRGPGIYRQTRVGKRGRKFTMYKIRTMRHDAEAASGVVWTQLHDPRITRLGRLLRRLHLDELPQLLNILKGEMSLVGPRPERPEFVHVLAEAVPGYVNRLAVPPGVTGLAQLNLPPDTDLDSVRRKLVLDCEYIRNAGLLLDARLFLATLLRMFRAREGVVLRVFGLSRGVTIRPALETPGSANSRGPATPAGVLVQAKSVSANGNGGPPLGQKHSGKRSRRNFHRKPR